jgi:phage-related protein
MKALSANLVRAKNMLGGDQPWLVLVQLILSEVTTLYLASNNEDVVFQGHTYAAFPLQIELPKETSKGEMPQIKLGLGNATREIQAQMEALNGGVGCGVRLIIVNAGLLTENYAELTLDFMIMSAECSPQWVSVSLGAPSLLKRRFPVDKYLANYCRFTFNSPAERATSSKGRECYYQGSMTTCNHTLADCKERGNAARFGGFPGLNAGGLRLA